MFRVLREDDGAGAECGKLDLEGSLKESYATAVRIRGAMDPRAYMEMVLILIVVYGFEKRYFSRGMFKRVNDHNAAVAQGCWNVDAGGGTSQWGAIPGSCAALSDKITRTTDEVHWERIKEIRQMSNAERAARYSELREQLFSFQQIEAEKSDSEELIHKSFSLLETLWTIHIREQGACIVKLPGDMNPLTGDMADSAQGRDDSADIISHLFYDGDGHLNDIEIGKIRETALQQFADKHYKGDVSP